MNSNIDKKRAPASGARWGLWVGPLCCLAAAWSFCAGAQQDTEQEDNEASAPALSFTTALSLPVGTNAANAAGMAVSPPAAPSPVQQAEAAADAPGPPPAGAAASGMQIGPGDTVSIEVYGRPELSTSAYIAENGTVNTPLAGPVQVAGMSPSDAAGKIADAYRNGGFLLQPQVNLTVKQFRSQQISVLGEVKSPGRYALDSRTSIFDLLAQAGGVTGDASDTIYLIRHADKNSDQTQRIAVAMQELVRHSAGDLSLQSGDSIYVPKASQFYIYGEVRTPNRYKLDPGTTVVQAIAMSGGVTERGSDSRIEIRRRNADGSFKTFSAHASDTVQADDVIRIKERIF